MEAVKLAIMTVNCWHSSAHALEYLSRADSLPHRTRVRRRCSTAEVFEHLRPGGVFCNLEHVASPTTGLHERFLEALGIQPAEEDSSNQLLDVETQLGWLKDIGFDDVDCHWKWRELALLAGVKPSTT